MKLKNIGKQINIALSVFARNILREAWDEWKILNIHHTRQYLIAMNWCAAKSNFLDGSTFSLGCIPYIGYLQAVLDIHLHVTLTI